MGMEHCGCNVGPVVSPVSVGPVCSPFTSTGAILVLFILLVIITKACLF